MALSEIRTQDAPYVIRMLLANRAAGESTWRFVTNPSGRAARAFCHPRHALHARAGISRLVAHMTTMAVLCSPTTSAPFSPTTRSAATNGSSISISSVWR